MSDSSVLAFVQGVDLYPPPDVLGRVAFHRENMILQHQIPRMYPRISVLKGREVSIDLQTLT